MFCFFFIKNMLIPHPDINSHLRDLRRNWNCGLKPVLSNYQLSQLHNWAIIGGCCLAWRWKFIKVPSSDGLWNCHRHTEVIDKSFNFGKKLLLFSLERDGELNFSVIFLFLNFKIWKYLLFYFDAFDLGFGETEAVTVEQEAGSWH